MRITTNNNRRPVINAWELTETERKEFDYIDWKRVESGENSAGGFIRYQGTLYDLGEFQRTSEMRDFSASGWHGYLSDSFFSGLVVKYANDFDDVIVGRYCS